MMYNESQSQSRVHWLNRANYERYDSLSGLAIQLADQHYGRL